jgi:2-methylcitrate dehydratase PrpD
MDFREISAELYDLIAEKAIADRHRTLAARHVRDWFACYMAGGATGQGRMFREYAGRKPDLEQSVFCVAALSKITESDDIHRATLTRPGSVIIPVAMVLGRHLGCNGPEVLDAIISGYEVAIRFGNALVNGSADAGKTRPAKGSIPKNDSGNKRKGVLNASPGGSPSAWNQDPALANAAATFGAAATAAILMKLEKTTFPGVLALAGCLAGGSLPFMFDEHFSGSVQAGDAAQSGLRAARLVSRGFKSEFVIPAHENARPSPIAAESIAEMLLAESSGWLIGETSMKPWPSCRFTHSAVDAAIKIREHLVENPFESIKSVKIHAPAEALRYTGVITPAAGLNGAARFHPAYSVCVALLKGAPDVGHYDPDQIGEVIRNPLMKKTAIVHHKPFDTHPARWPVKLEVGLGNGKVLSETVDVPLGDPEFPMSDAELDNKVISHLLYAGFNEDGAVAMLKSCREIVSADVVPQCWWLKSDDHQPPMN